MTGGGRPYPLLSESEQYRVDLLIAAALANLSGCKLLVADRADVLEPAARGELLGWLQDMTEAEDGGEAVLDQAWIFMTLKAQPTLDGAASFWIANGALNG
jgi:hypothetical protein